MDATATADPIGHHVEAILDHARFPGFPADRPQLANSFGLQPPRSKTMVTRRSPTTSRTSPKQSGQGVRQCRVNLPGNHEQRIAGAVVDPVVVLAGMAKWRRAT